MEPSVQINRWLDALRSLEDWLQANQPDLLEAIGNEAIAVTREELSRQNTGTNTRSTTMWKDPADASPAIREHQDRSQLRGTILGTLLASNLVILGSSDNPQLVGSDLLNACRFSNRKLFSIDQWSSIKSPTRKLLLAVVLGRSATLLRKLGLTTVEHEIDQLSDDEPSDEDYATWSVAIAAHLVSWTYERSIRDNKARPILLSSLVKSLILPGMRFHPGKNGALLPTDKGYRCNVLATLSQPIAAIVEDDPQERQISTLANESTVRIQFGRLDEKQNWRGRYKTGNNILQFHLAAAIELVRPVPIRLGKFSTAEEGMPYLPDKIALENIDAQHLGLAESIRNRPLRSGELRFSSTTDANPQAFYVDPKSIVLEDSTIADKQYLGTFRIKVPDFEARPGTTEFIDIALVYKDGEQWRTLRLEVVDQESEDAEEADFDRQDFLHAPIILDSYVAGSTITPERVLSLRHKLKTNSTWHYRQGECGLYFAGAIHE